MRVQPTSGRRSSDNGAQPGSRCGGAAGHPAPTQVSRPQVLRLRSPGRTVQVRGVEDSLT